MPILLFLIDTSASMSQRTHLGTTYLDIAKGAVETFMKLRARDPASRGDRYMLVTFDDPPHGIKAGWKENHATFMNELKNLQAVGLSTLGQSLRTSFDLLNLNRLVTGIDNYGQGRNPFFLEPSIIVTITDGNKLTNSSGIQDELHLPLNSPLPGSELTKEPFRWDQRLFSLVLRLPGLMPPEAEQLGSVPSDESAITPMCEVTGGRSYCVCTQRMLLQCLESLVQKVQSGVVLNFEKTGPDPVPVGDDGILDALKSAPPFGPQLWHSCHKLIYVRPNHKTGVPVGHWPIPESFWPDQNSPTLPPRNAHPVVKFSCVDCDPMVIDKLPFDKYELEPSPLTQFILERKSPHVCWQVYVNNSGKYSDLGHPFGYLKASTALNCVNLFVMPYNYPVLLPLLDDLFKVHKLKPVMKWRQAFENYLKTMPPYYIGPLKKALRMMGAPNLIAEGVDSGLSYSVISYLKKLSQQAKVESDRIISSVGKKLVQESAIKVKNRSNSLSLAHRKDLKQIMMGITGELPYRLMDLNVKEFAGFQIGILNKDLKPQSYKNAYDIPRRNLLDQLTRMRLNLLKTTHAPLKGQDEDQVHSVPIAQMGNYQEFLKHVPSPLRELDPDQPRRLHTFGNPFKLDKKGMMIDEADEFVSGPQNRNKRPLEQSMAGIPKRRRCMSPLLKGRTPTNYIGGKGPPLSPVPQPDLIKPIAALQEGEENQALCVDYVENNIADPIAVEITAQRLASAPSPIHSASASVESTKEPANHEMDSGFPVVNNNCISSVDLAHEQSKDSGKCQDGLLDRSSPNAIKTLMRSKQQETNTELRAQIFKEIRKPGRHYENIFYLLRLVQGSLETRMMFVQNVIKEAARFKKRVLIEELEGILEEIQSKSSRANHINNR
ncbi:integrator complex subunit 6 isoform X1 [Rhincodon typus]|uniref:integrator complex subunit 6 isoform X1 n=1 Tax=Rhincodon typus TaxID=259920 RepID=UPI0009A39D33|nr:integrator complex subunit 6 isoform X1 [Rhincodon typus]